MLGISTCPSAQDLQQFLLGMLSTKEAEQVEQHLMECRSCCEAARDLKGHDTLLEALHRASPTVHEGVKEEEVAGLVQRMAQLRRFSASSDETTAAEATAGPGPSEDITAAPSATLAGEKTEVIYDFLAPAQAPGELGRLGPYRVLKVLGTGGMGVVFQAEDPHLQRWVALKAMLPSLASNPSARQRFLREARAAAAIEHDHIVPIYQVGEDRGVPFLAMPFLKGEPLDQRLQREGWLPVSVVLRLGRQIADGLAAAHQRGLIHRDIKPGNIWLEGSSDRVKILDFGLARAAADSGQLTQSGAIVGTPAYMAPEQARAGTVDARCDLFSLGCVLYRMSTGQAPFAGKDTMAILSSLALDTPKPAREVNPRVPPALSDLIVQLLAKDPAERPQSARDVADLLADIEQEEGADADVHDALMTPRPSRRKPAGIQSEKKEESSKTLLAEQPLAAPASQAVLNRPGRRWAVAAAVVLLGLLGGGGYLFGPAVYRIATNRGQLVIETDDPDVEVIVKQNGQEVRIIDPKSGKEVTLKAGTYQVELAQGKEGLTLSTDRFTLQRGGKEVVRVWLESPVIGASPPTFGNQPAPKPAAGVIQPEPLPDLPPGTLLSPLALVSKPAPLKGVRSWTVETRGHRGGIGAVAYSPDGRWVATAGEDGTVRLWEAGTTQLARILVGHAADVRAVAWSPDSKYLATGSDDDTVRLWEAASGRWLRTLRGPNHVKSVVWSPDGQTLAAGDQASLIHLWEAGSGQLLRTLEAREGWVQGVAWSPDSKIVASGGGKTVRLWDVASGAPLRTLEGHTADILALTWSPDGKYLASSDQDRTVRLWQAASGNLLQTLRGHGGWVAALAWSPDSKTLASGGHDGLVQLWEADSGRQSRILQTTSTGVSGLTWSPDGQTLVAGSWDSTLRVWATGSGELLRARPGHVGGVLSAAWSGNGKTLATGGLDNSVRLWEADSGSLRQPILRAKGGGISTIAWAPDGKTLASAGHGWEVEIWNIESGKLRQLSGLPATVTALAWSPDGQTLASSHWDKTVHLWKVDADQPLRVLQLDAAILVVAWSPDSKTLATGGDDNNVILWEAASGKKLRTLTGHRAGISRLAWSPDGQTLASAADDGNVRLWATASGELRKSVSGYKAASAAAWSPDGKTLATVSEDGKVRFWDPPSGALRKSVQGPAGPGVLSPDLALGASYLGGAVRLWETDTGRLRGTLVPLAKDESLTLTAEGEHRGPAGIEASLVYVVQTDKGQETLPPEEFASKYGWKNDPEKVKSK